MSNFNNNEASKMVVTKTDNNITKIDSTDSYMYKFCPNKSEGVVDVFVFIKRVKSYVANLTLTIEDGREFYKSLDYTKAIDNALSLTKECDDCCEGKCRQTNMRNGANLIVYKTWTCRTCKGTGLITTTK